MNVPVSWNGAGHRRQANQIRTCCHHAISCGDAFQDLYDSVIANPEFHRSPHKRLAAPLDENHGTSGVIEALGAGYISDLTGGFLGSNYKDVFAFFVLILVLTLRPSGLLGERVGDRA